MKWQNKNKLKIIFEIVILILVIIVALKWILPPNDQFEVQIEGPVIEGPVAPIYYQIIDENTIRCQLCVFYCVLGRGEIGICGQIINKQGKLYYVQ